jgi:hypothetical protein
MSRAFSARSVSRSARATSTSARSAATSSGLENIVIASIMYGNRGATVTLALDRVIHMGSSTYSGAA